MIAEQVIEVDDCTSWRSALAPFERVDVCHMPEYHRAYRLRFSGAHALMWCYRAGEHALCYPFLLTPVVLRAPDGRENETGFNDISGIYGYSGPLSSTDDSEFLTQAWLAFDRWAERHSAICEFIRFSAYVGNEGLAHPETRVEYNRPVAIALLPGDTDTYLSQLGGKTRNMIRKADKSGLVAREVEPRVGLGDFRRLYDVTMERNQATDFFDYDDTYYDCLLELPAGELRLFAAYHDKVMVAAAMGLVHGGMAFYHLGASTPEASRAGGGNLVLFEMARALIDSGIGYFSVGGGRTTADDDPLYRFKKSNATGVGEFYIGKRVIRRDVYESVVKSWETMNDTQLTVANLQFYR